MFQSLTSLPPDPILGLTAAFRQDTNPNKVDLGIGVYKDEKGNTPVMKAVKQAEEAILDSQLTKAYLGPMGSPEFNNAVTNLILGKDLADNIGGRRVTIQTPGGCGGLRIAAEFIYTANANATIWVSDPTWANHKPLIGSAGLKFKSYPYYDYATNSVNFEGMIEALKNASRDDVVLLHGCCHNPSGADLSMEQWQVIKNTALNQGFTVFVDLAYQGMGTGLNEDVYGVRLLAESLPELVVVSSCSKNFGLYRERTGAVTLICESEKACNASSTLLASAARSNYSMPPDHGAAIVQLILNSPELYSIWEDELTEVRNRINSLRFKFAEKLNASTIPKDFSFIKNEKGMFSFLGANTNEIQELISNYGIYLVNSSRINVASINDSNIDYLIESITEVLRK
ncbi:MAG: aspartate/tyrosine/aromatic aminotransferase [Gammaproteobacteria bacterium]|nr:aspartate/tyrosine/aromatic aminotransferase [Gammaproteobacteria bacterium]